MNRLILASIAGALASATANATVLTTSIDNLAVMGSPLHGPIVEAIGKSTISTGLDFSWGHKEGLVVGPPNRICGSGCNYDGIYDARVVMPGTLHTGLTSWIHVEIGTPFAGTVSIFASGPGVGLYAENAAFNYFGPSDPNHTYLDAVVAADLFSAFEIGPSVYDPLNKAYGIYSVSILSPSISPVAGVPEPANWAMLISGCGLIGAEMRRRRRQPIVAV